MNHPQRDAIKHLDFQLACGAPKAVNGGKPCTAPATFYTERHAIGACFHPSLNSGGNFERFLCQTHLQAAEVEAERVARRHQPVPWWLRWLRDNQPSCPTCGRTIQNFTDVLQVVRGL